MNPVERVEALLRLVSQSLKGRNLTPAEHDRLIERLHEIEAILATAEKITE